MSCRFSFSFTVCTIHSILLQSFASLLPLLQNFIGFFLFQVLRFFGVFSLFFFLFTLIHLEDKRGWCGHLEKRNICCCYYCYFSSSITKRTKTIKTPPSRSVIMIVQCLCIWRTIPTILKMTTYPPSFSSWTNDHPSQQVLFVCGEWIYSSFCVVYHQQLALHSLLLFLLVVVVVLVLVCHPKLFNPKSHPLLHAILADSLQIIRVVHRMGVVVIVIIIVT